MIMLDNLMTVKEAAQVLGVTPIRVRQFCTEGRLGRRFGNRWAITKDEVRKFKKRDRPTGRPRRAS